MRVSYSVILGIAIFFNVLTIIFIGHLICFHIILQREDKTTFEYILEKNNRKNQKSKIYRDVNNDKKDAQSKPPSSPQEQRLETLDKDNGDKEKQAPKTEDGKKNEDFNVAFKDDKAAGEKLDKKESIDILDDGKIIRGNTTEDMAGVTPALQERNKAALNH